MANKNINDGIMESNLFKILNYIVTSDNDSSYIKEDKKKIAKNFRIIYLIMIILICSISFFPFFLPPSEQAELTRNIWFVSLNMIGLVFLLIDYILRWITYPVRIKKQSVFPLLFFPFTGISILMILSMLPTTLSIFSRFFPIENTFTKIVNAFAIMKILRLVLLLKIIPVFNVFNNIFIKQKILLINVFLFVSLLTIIFALIIYSVEGANVNEKINSYGDALYFTIITMTTIGYGDISPVTNIGKIVVVFISILGVTVFTIPSGIIAGSFMFEMQEKYKNEKEDSFDNNKKTSLIERIVLNFSRKSINKINKKENEIELESIILIKGINLNENIFILEKIISFLGEKENIMTSNNINQTSYEFKIKDKNKVKKDLFDLINVLDIEINQINK